jgi:hypothetical protein
MGGRPLQVNLWIIALTFGVVLAACAPAGGTSSGGDITVSPADFAEDDDGDGY